MRRISILESCRILRFCLCLYLLIFYYFFQVIIEQFAEKDDYKDMAHSFLDILYSTEDEFVNPEDED